MPWLLGLLAAVTGLAAATAAYLASPNQKLLARRPQARGMLVSGAVLAFASLLLMFGVLGPAAAIFAWLTLLMAAWTALPFLGLTARRTREKR